MIEAQIERSLIKEMVAHANIQFRYTVGPLNNGHLGTLATVPYSEVVPN